MQTQYKISDRLMPEQAKGQPVFPVFEVIAIKEFNMQWCYICFVRLCLDGFIQGNAQLVPLAVEQDGFALYSVEGEYTTTTDEDLHKE